jgi:hypothetical protein
VEVKKLNGTHVQPSELLTDRSKYAFSTYKLLGEMNRKHLHRRPTLLLLLLLLVIQRFVSPQSNRHHQPAGK